MKVKTVTYERLKSTGMYQNERSSVTIELEKGDDVFEAQLVARRLVERDLYGTVDEKKYDEAKKLIESFQKDRELLLKLKK